MKDQYFADRRDFFKWDLLEDLLDSCANLIRLTSILMLTPPDDSREGNQNQYAIGNRRKALYEFLQGCLNDNRQHVSEMKLYFRNKRFEYFPYGDTADNYYSYETRDQYFAGIPESKLGSSLIFFDPDIGLNAGSMSYMRRSGISKYLHENSIQQLSQRIPDSSALVVYQHLQRDRSRFWDDIEDRSGKLVRAVGSQGISFITDRDVAFLVTSRHNGLRFSLGAAIVRHAHSHNLDSGELVA